jgi:hypothetical protein
VCNCVCIRTKIGAGRGRHRTPLTGERSAERETSWLCQLPLALHVRCVQHSASQAATASSRRCQESNQLKRAPRDSRRAAGCGTWPHARPPAPASRRGARGRAPSPVSAAGATARARGHESRHTTRTKGSLEGRAARAGPTPRTRHSGKPAPGVPVGQIWRSVRCALLFLPRFDSHML